MNGPGYARSAQFPYLLDTLLLGVKITIIVTLGGFVAGGVLGLAAPCCGPRGSALLRAVWHALCRRVPRGPGADAALHHLFRADGDRHAARPGAGGDHRLRDQWRAPT